jgi:hypothetical protein
MWSTSTVSRDASDVVGRVDDSILGRANDAPPVRAV